jgi:hypothetical protein
LGCGHRRRIWRPKIAADIIQLHPGAQVTLVEKGITLSVEDRGGHFNLLTVAPDQEDLVATALKPLLDSALSHDLKTITVLYRTEAIEIDRQLKSVWLRRFTGDYERRIEYDKLVLATGALPIIPLMPGVGLSNIFTIKGMEAIFAGARVDQVSELDHYSGPTCSPFSDSITIAANVLKDKMEGYIIGISSIELKQRLDEGENFMLLDVRTSTEYKQKRIADSTLIPLDQLRQRARQLPEDKENAIHSGTSRRVAHREDCDFSSMEKMCFDGALRLLAFAQTYVNLIDYGFFGSSRNGEVTADYLKPSQSAVWREINRMIELLEQ